ncbi:bifunctional 3-(3-hydroxy-phenyl)propionate/3-hydroxycinnamic acid hydroxylase [Pseudooceanicola sp. GBMRC 2024]|uniref:Bifunctional 3-(3-hydroxy-phenyl)propionate/3-hydroxycinnamic acid hydroxylase n=1 Tax=Pseudooceanicola albus TaxID=2692189 RepID=A0A6L7G1M4_9RHOB|nr:bifunctional 3-(3-hydroxy-phenyl)propionate/3-hydroxycinnamic acid hydroxylase [Pseudooceanicola albus]MXN17901.1 bifunctional 3-(3-hydroxy-phenyl)propionate/3-hydroxycinnamic acid hydroxylase [Pseudooceanicola albus]
MTRPWDVIITGCGPVGAFAANLLGGRGLRVLVLDRDTAPYALPRAVHIDHEMLRLLADAGLLEGLRDGLHAGDGHIHIGADHGVIRFLSAAGQPRPFGYANDYFFYQPELEAGLRAGLERFPNVTLRLGAEVTGLTQDEAGVTLTLADGGRARALWVIGSDGARSTLRKALGVVLEDLEFEEPWLVADAEVEGPIRFPDFTGVPEGADLQNLSLMMCDPARPATIVPGRGNHRRWEFMLLPGEDDARMARPESVAALMAPWLGDTPHAMIRAATYRFHGLVAQHWRRGRVFLAGDAAHQTPPFFGQGMCHGMRDAANLAWKLDLVCRGLAEPGLLDSYQPERDGQVRHVIGAAIEAGRYICELDPGKAAERDARIRARTGMRTAAELIAPIASGLIGPGGGERFVNPAVTGPKGPGLLDDATGGGWVLLCTDPPVLSGAAEEVLSILDAAVLSLGADLTDTEGHLARWFAARGAVAALLRPDFYLAAWASDGAGTESMIAAQGRALHLAPGQADLAAAAGR